MHIERGKKPRLQYKKSTTKVQPCAINVQKNPCGVPAKTGTGFAITGFVTTGLAAISTA
jgi:hypothetical protein